MARRPIRQSTDKLIHIRLDGVTHQKLKIEAASSGTTIQQIVEDMLKKKFRTSK